ncbi:MAG: hypothetical protein ABFE13_21515, partial [Phycisphaerales bacterium]
MLAPSDSGDRKRHVKVAGYALVVVPAAVICLTLTSVLANWWGWSANGSGQRTADWPMWRCDASRSGASPVSLPADLHLQWVRELPKPAPAWREEQYKLQFDRSYEPVVMGRQIFVPSMASDKIEA